MSVSRLVEYQDYVLAELSFYDLCWCWPADGAVPKMQDKGKGKGDEEKTGKIGGLQVGNIVKVIVMIDDTMHNISWIVVEGDS
eukprot:11285394-Karenia_brevis.AAC.1